MSPNFQTPEDRLSEYLLQELPKCDGKMSELARRMSESIPGGFISDSTLAKWRKKQVPVAGIRGKTLRTFAGYRKEDPEQTIAWLEGRSLGESQPYNSTNLSDRAATAPLSELPKIWDEATNALRIVGDRLFRYLNESTADNKPINSYDESDFENLKRKAMSKGSIAKILSFYIEENKVEREQFAVICGVSLETVDAWLDSACPLTKNALKQIAKGVNALEPKSGWTADSLAELEPSRVKSGANNHA